MSSSKGFRKYGFWFPEGFNELSVELFAYSITRGEWGKLYCRDNQIDLSEYSFLDPFEHLVNYIQMQWDSNVVCLHNRGYRNHTTLRVLEKLCHNDDIVIAGAASMSKSFPVSLFCLSDWQAAPHCTSSWVATTSLGASEDRIWGILAGLYADSKMKIGQLIDYRHMIVWSGADFDESKDYASAIKALAFPPGGEGAKAVATTRGRKNARCRLFIDELPEMENLVLNTKTNLSANDDVIFCGIGNPSAEDNPHTKWCLPKGCENFDSVNPDMDEWETQTGICLYFNGKKSPNMQAPEGEPVPFPFLLDRKKIARMLQQNYGDENAVDFMRNAIGWWPKSGFVQTVIKKSVVEEANTFFEPFWNYGTEVMLGGFDTSFTSGGDRCVLSVGKLGNIRGVMKKVLWLKCQEVLIARGDSKEEFEDAMAKKVVAACIKHGISPVNFGMDVSGDGGRMAQAIIKEWMKVNATAVSIYLISSMGKPSEAIVSSIDTRPCSEAYDRIVTEYWYSSYHGFKTRSLYGVDPNGDLVREMSKRRYKIVNKKISIESKDDYKEREGQSPDLADSYNYLVCMAKRAGLEFIVDDKSENMTMRDYFRQKEAEENTVTQEEEEYAFDDWGED